MNCSGCGRATILEASYCGNCGQQIAKTTAGVRASDGNAHGVGFWIGQHKGASFCICAAVLLIIFILLR